MNLKNFFSVLFRKYSSVRLGILIFLVAAAFLIISLATVKSKKSPSIQTIVPSVGSPGDTMIIKGSNFGENRGNSFVEIGGSRVTASGYLSWSDDTIRIVLPANVQDGLVFVQTKSGKSKPEFFANETGIPVEVRGAENTFQPVITSVQPSECSYGSLVTISGTNFGSSKGKNNVLFSANRDDAKLKQQNAGDKTGELELQYIVADSDDFDYESWSDSEIKVRVPDGAISGPVVVRTEKGDSNSYELKIDLTSEIKSFTSRKTYLIEVYADIENLDSKNSTNITLRMPKPVTSANQPLAEMTECSPNPVLEDFKNTVVYRFELAKSSKISSKNPQKQRFKQDYIISSYDVSTNINPKNVRDFSAAEKERALYKTYVASDELVKLDENVKNLAGQITGKEKNPYQKARMIYDYLLENYKLLKDLRKTDASPYDLEKKNSGDAYDFAVFYTALLRASQIPAATMSGILVDTDLSAKNHWWTEFYLENFGWIPVDVALGMGMEYKSFKAVDDAKSFYFGNLDGQHIAFSRGWNELKRTISENSKVVARQRTYALQSIWEESSEGKVNYSSLWNDPVVKGIY